MGTPLTPVADHEHASEAALEALGETTFDTAWKAGNEAPFEEPIVASLEK